MENRSKNPTKIRESDEGEDVDTGGRHMSRHRHHGHGGEMLMGDDIIGEYGDIDSRHETRMGKGGDRDIRDQMFGGDGHFSFDFANMDKFMKQNMKSGKGDSYRMGRHSKKSKKKSTPAAN